MVSLRQGGNHQWAFNALNGLMVSLQQGENCRIGLSPGADEWLPCEREKPLPSFSVQFVHEGPPAAEGTALFTADPTPGHMGFPMAEGTASTSITVQNHPVRLPNRDSISAKVLGKRGEGAGGGERKALLQKGFLSPPPVSFLGVISRRTRQPRQGGRGYSRAWRGRLPQG